MSIKTTKPVEDSERLGGQLPAYYAQASKLSEKTEGAINISSGSPSINMWQRRNGWVRLAIMASGMTLAHGDIFAQIVGDSGLVNAIAFVGTCMGTDGVTRQCIFNVNASGQISARNDNAVVMSRVAFDVTLPALNV